MYAHNNFTLNHITTIRDGWFAGRIVEVHAPTGRQGRPARPGAQPTYDVQFNDGDFEKGVPTPLIRRWVKPNENEGKGAGKN